MFSRSATAAAAPGRKRGGRVRDVYMALPDVAVVEMIDADLTSGGLEYHPEGFGGATSLQSLGGWQGPYANHKGVSKLGWITGLNNDHIRFVDKQPTSVLDRNAAKNPSLWRLEGAAVTITAVYFAALPYRGGFHTGTGAGGVARKASNMLYKVYLQLSGNLSEGSYRLHFPPTVGFEDYIFNYTTKATFSDAYKINVFGHRPDDPVKEARFVQFVPGRPGHGRVDFVNEYSSSTFYMIDADGNVVGGPYPIVQVQAPDDNESWNFPSTYTSSSWQGYGLGNGLRKRNHPSSSDVADVLTATAGNPGKITLAAGHPFVEGDIVFNGGITGISGQPTLMRLDNQDGDTFDVYNPQTSSYSVFTGTFAAPTVIRPLIHKVARLISGNASNNYVFRLDYSAFTPETEGYYKIHIPGFASSDPIWFGADAWEQQMRFLTAGEYHQRMGCELDGRFNYKRPTALRSGVDTTYYRCRLPVGMTDQGSMARGGFGSVTTVALTTEGWLYPRTPEYEADAAGEYADAGDWDILSHIHIDTAWDMMFLWRTMTSAQKQIDLGIPKCSHPTLHLGSEYAEIDHAPSLVHMMAWPIDWMRRCQTAEGAVPSGSLAPNQGKTYMTGGILWDPSFLWYMQPYTAAPDHHTNYIYAGLAATYASILDEVGAPLLAAIWRDSAIRAFNWSETLVKKAITWSTSSAATLTAGVKVFTVTHGAPWVNGDRIRYESRADPTNNWMEGTVTARSIAAAFTTGAMTVSFDSISPTKTVDNVTSLTDWDMKNTDNDRFAYYDTLVDGGMRRRTVVTGDCSSSNALITNIQPNTDGIRVGDYVTLNSGSVGIVSGTRIVKSIDSPSQVTLRSINDLKDKNNNYLYQAPNANNQNATGASLLFRVYGLGITDTTYFNSFWNSGVESFHRSALSSRTYASACLMRYAGVNQAMYRQVCECNHNTANRNGWDMLGWIEYVGMDGAGPGGGTTYTSYFKSVIQDSSFRAPANASLIWQSEQNANAKAWPLMMGGAAIDGPATHYTNRNWNIRCQLFWAHITPTPSERERIIAAHIRHSSWIFGMNLQGTPYASGVHGRYRFRSNLHDTSYIDGQADNGKGGDSPAGIVLFGPDLNTYGIIRDNWHCWGEDDQHGQFSTGYAVGDADTAARMIEPHMDCFPGYWLFDNRWNISSMEFGMTGIIQNWLIAGFLSCRGGNTPSNRPYLFQ
jgi:hypothetical protein